MSEVGLAARWLVGTVFIVAAVSKVLHRDRFRDTLRELGVGPNAVGVATWVVIAVEAIVGAGLVLGGFGGTPALASLVLLLTFGALGLWARLRALTIECNCFGESSSRLGINTVARSGLLVLTLLSAILTGPIGNTPVPTSVPDFTITVALAAGGLTLGRWMLSVPVLVALMRSRREAVALATSVVAPGA